MKINSNIISVIVAAFLMIGCASGPSFNEYSASIPVMDSNTGRIYIYRTSSFGAAIQPKIPINREVVGSAVPKGFFYIDRPAGNYEISASTEAKRSLTLSLEPGDERYV